MFIHKNPLPLAFAAELKGYAYPARPLLDFLIELHSNVAAGSTRCEFPRCQFDTPLMRQGMSVKDVDLFIYLVIINILLPDNRPQHDDDLKRNMLHNIQSFRDDASDYSIDLLMRTNVESMIGSNDTDKAKRTITLAIKQLNHALDQALLLIPITNHLVINHALEIFLGKSDDNLPKLFKILFLDQFAISHFIEKDKIGRHINAIMTYGLHLSSILDDKYKHPVDPYRYRDVLSSKRRESAYSSTAYPVHLLNMADWIINLQSMYKEKVEVNELIMATFAYYSKQHLHEEESALLQEKILNIALT